MNAAVLFVFVIDLRHGADPNNLAAIDTLTRNADDKMPRANRVLCTVIAGQRPV